MNGNKTAARKAALVNKKICVACGACRKVCPRSAIRIVHGCYAAVDGELCVGCGLCVRICPASCIQLTEKEALS